MAHAEFVLDIRIVEGRVSDDKISEQQFLEHIGANVSGPLLFIGTEHYTSDTFKRRFDIVSIYCIEIDPFFYAKRRWIPREPGSVLENGQPLRCFSVWLTTKG